MGVLLWAVIAAQEPLAGTAPLTWEGDLAERMVAGVDKFLLAEIEQSVGKRHPDRKRLAHILGVRDARVPFDAPELVGTIARPALVGRGEGYEIFAVRWPAFGDVTAEGLLLVPSVKIPYYVVAIPDADQTPEQLCGLAEGIAPEAQTARLWAQQGARVLVPTLISRELRDRGRGAVLTGREFIYRSAFELGRHIIGYEVRKVLAGVDWFAKDGEVSVAGNGEGGLIALCAAALDTRIECATVSGSFDSRQNVWLEPIDRNVFGLLRDFGDAEIASMIAPRGLIVEATKGPELTLAPGGRGAPGRLLSPSPEAAEAEFKRAQALAGPTAAKWRFVRNVAPNTGSPPQRVGELPDAAARQARQLHELDRHNQRLLAESAAVRQEFFKGLDTSSVEKFNATVERYRDIFRDEVIGRFENPVLPMNPRTRKAYDQPKWTGYEVVLDVFPDVFAYGILLVPKDIKEGERRPVVVCQHGLEGRPQDIVAGDHAAYHDFAAKLAERGFITFAPQNLYIFKDKFRTLQRKANPLGKTLFSIIVPQHQQIVDWLQTLPVVDPERIGFYGLSYGGKSAMRIPPLVKDYKLSICSADFNEWVWKNASSRAPHSYVWTGEYEIFEFDLGSTFNYAEMAALICPRPFMVERGHFDGVAPDETVAYEFAKVRHLYNGKLGIGDRVELEWFAGPHTINGKGTFDFLHRHLKWPRP